MEEYSRNLTHGVATKSVENWSRWLFSWLGSLSIGDKTEDSSKLDLLASINLLSSSTGHDNKSRGHFRCRMKFPWPSRHLPGGLTDGRSDAIHSGWIRIRCDKSVYCDTCLIIIFSSSRSSSTTNDLNRHHIFFTATDHKRSIESRLRQ